MVPHATDAMVCNTNMSPKDAIIEAIISPRMGRKMTLSITREMRATIRIPTTRLKTKGRPIRWIGQ